MTTIQKFIKKHLVISEEDLINIENQEYWEKRDKELESDLNTLINSEIERRMEVIATEFKPHLAKMIYSHGGFEEDYWYGFNWLKSKLLKPQ